MPNQALQRSSTTPSEIPDKLYFRIGDVARLCQVPAYVLRFWETEFPQLKPNKGGTGQRLYRKREVELALKIKRLLYDEGYTIPGARQALLSETREARKQPAAPLLPPPTASESLQAGIASVRKDLRELHAALSLPVSVGTKRPRLKLEKTPNSAQLFELE